MGNCSPKPAKIRRPYTSGSADTDLLDAASTASVLSYAESKLAGSDADVPAARKTAAEEMSAAVAVHHRSMERHVAKLAGWAAAVAERKKNGFLAADLRKIAREYAKSAEVMLEHAQMEEKLIFPVIERAANRDVYALANGEHARDLPMINGIKEDIKTLLAMDAASPFLREALTNLHRRFKTLQEHCKEHFKAEEKEILPLLEAAELVAREEGDDPSNWPEQILDIMESTHSHLLPFFFTGLTPDEATQYIDFICRATADRQRMTSMLEKIVSWLQGSLLSKSP